MLDQAILEYGREKGFHKQTLERWLKFPEADREAMLELARGLRTGENHFRDLMDWLEEVSLRDGVSVLEILKGKSIEPIWSDPRLGRNDKLRRIKEELRRLRFPRLVQVEGEIQKRIRQMKLRPQIKISVPPNLEGGTLTLQLRATGHEELRGLFREISQILEGTEMKEIFDLLMGREQNAGFSAS
ncbi:MAG: hypothetical protein V3T60_02900 [Candidatus Binatia bacterium]